jgi:hypothetical protein
LFHNQSCGCGSSQAARGSVPIKFRHLFGGMEMSGKFAWLQITIRLRGRSRNIVNQSATNSYLPQDEKAGEFRVIKPNPGSVGRKFLPNFWGQPHIDLGHFPTLLESLAKLLYLVAWLIAITDSKFRVIVLCYLPLSGAEAVAINAQPTWGFT